MAIFCGLFIAKYSLTEQYNALDDSNPFQGFEEIKDLTFNHIRIEGGNRNHLFVEPGAENKVFISKRMNENVTPVLSNDTLIVEYPENLTIDSEFETNQWGSREGATIIIQCKALQSLVANNASVGMNLENSPIFTIDLNGGSNLAIDNSDASLSQLYVKAGGNSQLKLNENGGESHLNFMALQLNGQSLTELHQVQVDSTAFELKGDSKILAGSNFF